MSNNKGNNIYIILKFKFKLIFKVWSLGGWYDVMVMSYHPASDQTLKINSNLNFNIIINVVPFVIVHTVLEKGLLAEMS